MIKFRNKKIKGIDLNGGTIKAFIGNKLVWPKGPLYVLQPGKFVSLDIQGGKSYLFESKASVVIQYKEFDSIHKKTIVSGYKWTTPSFGQDFKAKSSVYTILKVIKQGA